MLLVGRTCRWCLVVLDVLLRGCCVGYLRVVVHHGIVNTCYSYIFPVLSYRNKCYFEIGLLKSRGYCGCDILLARRHIAY